MVKLIGIWDGWNESAAEAELWHFMARDFDVAEVVMAPLTGLKHKAIAEVASVADAIEQARQDGFTVVVLDEKAEQGLPDFEHPDKVAYVFGGAASNPTMVGDLSVRIPTGLTKGLLWGNQAAAIVLYDRGLKWQSR